LEEDIAIFGLGYFWGCVLVGDSVDCQEVFDEEGFATAGRPEDEKEVCASVA
jgi:hypothetical protein